MKILALDTATEACSAALQIGDQILIREEIAPQAHTKLILPMVQALIDEAQIQLTDLDAIVFGRGPGSFTGVRIGVGIAQGLAYGAGTPLIGVSTLQTLAQGALRRTGCSLAVAAIDARMSEVYLGAFVSHDGLMQPLCDEVVIAPDGVQAYLQQIKNTSLRGAAAVGTGFTHYTELVESCALASHDNADTSHLPWSQDMLPLAIAAFKAGQFSEPAQATPVYLRDKVTWKKLPGRE
jgi:tRNA threonylcarbamoyladenosine biosynthesis protein TsaB